jgi:hypothetical protein
MSKRVKTHSFNGYRYNVIFDKFDGATDTDKSPRDMLIGAKPKTQNELITIIHEAMHAGNWDKHEETIDRSSKEIGRFLWRLGYRR